MGLVNLNKGLSGTDGGSSSLSLPDGQILVGNALNVAAPVTMSGDVSIDNTGATTIKSSVALAGDPTTTTQSSSDNSTKIATTAMVQSAIAAAVAGGASFRGSYDASTNLYPSTGGSGVAGAILSGDFWVVSVSGTLGGVPAPVGSLLFAIVDSPGQTSSNWVNVSAAFVMGAASATNSAVALFDGTTGKVIKNSGVTFTGILLDHINAAGLTLSDLTASELVATDGSKNLQSLPVATYPSLTEVSYVKGVTSSIQPQINSKQDVLSLGSGVASALAENIGSPGGLVISKTLTAMTPSGSDGSVSVAHGLDASKILGVIIRVDYGDTTMFLGDNYTTQNGSNIGWHINATNFNLQTSTSNSGNVLSKIFKVTIFYTP